MADFAPHPAVHRPWTFICAMDDPDASAVAYAEHPARHIASRLLEDVGDWDRAIKGLEHTDVPLGVRAALDQLHEAVCGWTEWNERREGSAR